MILLLCYNDKLSYNFNRFFNKNTFDVKLLNVINLNVYTSYLNI